MAAVALSPAPAPWSEPLPPPPSSPPQPEFERGATEVLEGLAGCRWLFPPTRRPGRAPPGAAAAQAPRQDFLAQYDFRWLVTEEARGVVAILLTPSASAARPGDSLAESFGRALEKFALTAFRVLSWAAPGRVVQSEDDRQHMVTEAGQVLRELIQQGHFVVHRDLVLCLESFGVGKGRPRRENDWLCKCLQCVIQSGLEVAPPEDVATWRAKMTSRMTNEPELYSNIDVRAWPHILELLRGDSRAIIPEVFQTQVRLQLCMGSNRAQLSDGLQQAALLIAELRQQEAFGPDEVRTLFNDRRFNRQERRELLVRVLRSAPRPFAHKVVAGMDYDDTDVLERDDQEMALVMDLIRELHLDIRSCKYAFYRMKSEWIAGRYTGVVHNESLTPEQLCDHIEDEDNHELLLRVAVNRCLKFNRKFEAARMLARPKSENSRAFEANRNDKQLAYLMSLYQSVQPPPDRFGPVERHGLVLPLPAGSGPLVVDCAGPALQRLEAELLGSKQPRVAGIWWFWRCFDPRIDFWPRASTLALAYDDTFCLVDFVSLEHCGDEVELQGKDVVRRILSAPHILKVVHELDERALMALQCAVVRRSELHAEAPPWPSVAPVLDLAIVAAHVWQTRPVDVRCSKLARLVFDFLRLETCLAESLSNFERRPLRETQMHYMLSVAWCPSMVLRALCSFGIVSLEAVIQLVLHFGEPSAPPRMDSLIRTLHFAPPDSRSAVLSAQDFAGIAGAYAQNLWTDGSEESGQWRERLPRPHAGVSLREAMEPVVLAQLPEEALEPAIAAAQLLFDRASTIAKLEAMYTAYEVSQVPF